MEYISAEEFLKQPVEVQKVLIDWWQLSKGDLFSPICPIGIGVLNGTEHNSIKEDLIPLLTEGQLRQFIGDKTVYKLEITQFEDGEWSLCLYKHGSRDIEIDDMDLLQAYWKVATEIAKESKANNCQ
ncbi:hypothetical protein [Clostridium sp. VAP41]|uniref:hypothetical protein n=1 Tax=Clostridium sp. VAP41 TaxID=2949979 RepID=UPI00207A4682|nr:hypothetical protein [Clostridium sp. VAP41]